VAVRDDSAERAVDRDGPHRLLYRSKGIVRALIYYPLFLGRNMDDIRRVVDGLQLNAREGLALPADWRPGQPAIIPAPATVEGLRQRLRKKDDPKQKTWYYKTKG
jgi:peroxiredoxin (alkyl hydroperoxide reductase subunit C)